MCDVWSFHCSDLYDRFVSRYQCFALLPYYMALHLENTGLNHFHVSPTVTFAPVYFSETSMIMMLMPQGVTPHFLFSKSYLYEISGHHDSNCEDHCLMGRGATMSGRSLPTFWQNMVLESSYLQWKVEKYTCGLHRVILSVHNNLMDIHKIWYCIVLINFVYML